MRLCVQCETSALSGLKLYTLKLSFLSVFWWGWANNYEIAICGNPFISAKCSISFFTSYKVQQTLLTKNLRNKHSNFWNIKLFRLFCCRYFCFIFSLKAFARKSLLLICLNICLANWKYVIYFNESRDKILFDFNLLNLLSLTWTCTTFYRKFRINSSINYHLIIDI